MISRHQGPHFQGYIEALNKIEQSRVNARQEAQDILTLLTCMSPLALSPRECFSILVAIHDTIKFQVPLQILGSSPSMSWYVDLLGTSEHAE
ncbi:hypothetical protein BJV78DRAFT_1260865 [Lactifluus subvellereus]|nr:hypothetical protein BJV78DRAFT_1260865 [Lactifluus subvellereus]